MEVSMRDSQGRMGALVISMAVAAGLLVAPDVSAQDQPVRIGAVGKSMCSALTPKEVGRAIGYKMGASDEVDHCEWHARGSGDPEVGVYLGWADLGISDIKALPIDEGSPETRTDMTVGGRPALLKGGTYPPYLLVELEQGPITLQASDPYGGDYSDALVKLGELVVPRAETLVPLPPGDPVLLSLVPTAIGDAPVGVQVAYPEKVFPKGSGREELNKALKRAGKKITDVSLVQGGVANTAAQATVNALRVAGADASDFGTLGIMATGVWGVSPVPDPVPNGTIGVAAMPSGGDIYVYPKDDVVWIVFGDHALAAEVLAALPGAPILPEPTPAPTPDLSTPEGYLTSLLPPTIAGRDLTIQVYPGKVALTADGIKLFTPVLKDQGKTIDDVTVAAASDGAGTAIQGFRIAGGDSAPLEPVLVKVLRESGLIGKKAKTEPVQIVGKSVDSIQTSLGTAYLYPSGDVLWLVQAPDDAALNEVFTALP
jgi:hypothetical protein